MMIRGLWLLTFVFSATAVRAEDWQQLSPIPNAEGVAGTFAGVSHNVLLVAGGANFPDKKPWEGGTKTWYADIFALESLTGKWRTVGKLPRPLGYGVSVTHRNTVVCVGGNDAVKHYAAAFRLEWIDGQVKTSDLPPLPHSLAMAAGAVVGDKLIIAGGLERPDSNVPLKSVWTLNLAADKPNWEKVADIPGPGRLLPVAAAQSGSFYVLGGADLVAKKDGLPARRYLSDGYRYTPGTGWQRIADLPRPTVAAPSPTASDATGVYLCGGDDGSHVGFQPPEKHPGFGKLLYRYDVKADRWNEVGHYPAGHVTTPLVIWQQRWIIPSGEIRPGVRAAAVWSYPPH